MGKRVAARLYGRWVCEMMFAAFSMPNYSADVLDALRIVYKSSHGARNYLDKWSTHDFKKEPA